MTYAPIDVRLDPHREDNSVVLAHLTGPRANAARHILLAHTFQPAPGRGPDALVLVRVDREEAHYGEAATRALRKDGITVGVDFELQQDFDDEWTWVDYPMPWLTREEIREVGVEAQKIHDDIAAGILVIHRHALDGHSRRGGHLQRRIQRAPARRGPPAAGYGNLRRPGRGGGRLRPHLRRRRTPRPRARHQRRTAHRPHPQPHHEPDSAPGRTAPSPTTVPFCDGDPGDHEGLLDSFLAQEDDWEKYRPHDETTIASHESLLMRVEFVHEPESGEPRWTVAAYESPVGERLWHATATASTPVEMVAVLLDTLISGAVEATEPAVSEKAIAHLAQPLTDWTQSVEGRFIRWTPPRGDGAGVVFDAFAAQARLPTNSRTWTVWGGDNADHPVWAMHLSPNTSAEVLHDLAVELAEGRCQHPRPDLSPPPVRTASAMRLEAPAPALTVTPPTTAHVSAGPHRHAR
jgi:Domain of unknown function (DUF317)